MRTLRRNPLTGGIDPRGSRRTTSDRRNPQIPSGIDDELAIPNREIVNGLPPDPKGCPVRNDKRIRALIFQLSKRFCMACKAVLDNRYGYAQFFGSRLECLVISAIPYLPRRKMGYVTGCRCGVFQELHAPCLDLWGDIVGEPRNVTAGSCEARYYALGNEISTS